MSEEYGVLEHRLATLHDDVTEIKTALRALSDAITKLALVEERQSRTAESLERAFKAIAKVEERLSVLEAAKPAYDRTNVWVDKALWVAAGAAVVFVAKHVGLL